MLTTQLAKNHWQGLDRVLQQLHSPHSALLHEAKQKSQLAQRLAELGENQKLLAHCKTALPTALAEGLLAVSIRRNALMLTAKSHSVATSLYQWQGDLLAHANQISDNFTAKAESNQKLNLDEVRISTKPSNIGAKPSNNKIGLPSEAAQSLARLHEDLPDGELREAVQQLMRLLPKSD